MSSTKKRVITLLLTMALTSAICILMYFHDNKYHEDAPQAIAGLLILENDDLETYPLRHLVDDWSFYPDLLLTPEDFTNGSPGDYMITTAVGEQTRFTNPTDRNNPYGSGSYVMNLVLPKEVQTYALEVPEVYSAYKLYINERLVLQMGNPEPSSYVPRTQNRTVTFEASERARIIIAVSNYTHFYSGMVYPPAFGTSLAVNTTRDLRMGIALFVDTLALLAAALALYFGLRMKHQNAKLFSLLCVVMCVFTSYSLVHSMLVLPVFPWYALEMASGYLLSLLLVVLHNRICETDLYAKRISTVIVAVVCVVSLCYGLFSAYLTVPMMQAFSSMIFWYKLAMPTYLLVTGYFALRSGENDKATPLFYASIIYATTFLWDRIFPSYEPILSGWFIEWGSLSLVAAIGYTLWRDITTAYANNLTFVEEHRLMNRQLAMQTEYARQLQKINNENRRLTHDFRHQMHAIKGMAAKYGEDNEILRYLSSQGMPVITPVYNTSFCKNVAVDALLQYYSAVTAANHIKTSFRLVLPAGLPLTNVELCTILGNLLENAVEACLRQKEGTRYLQISYTLVEQTLFLIVENSSDGNYRLRNGHFLSRKPGDLRFGIGLESVRHTVERHGGTLSIYPLAELFRVGIVLPIHGRSVQENSH